MEINKLTGNESLPELKDFFVNLAQEKGAEYAYEALKVAKTRPGIDMHLMGHYIGEILYRQKGAEGIKYCTPDFRNACSHTIVVGLFSEKGVKALTDIEEACKKAPGGRGAYNICYHGLGHGVLAYTGYNLEKTVALCKKTSEEKRSMQESSECIGGAIMELISGGDHDKALWQKQSAKYLTTEDPLFPCSTEIIPITAKRMCYTYLTPHLINYAGGNLGHPSDDDFAKAFSYCGALPLNNTNRKVCYGAFGKEFVVLAKERDIRRVETIKEKEIKTIDKWCHLADWEEGEKECLIGALGSIYWGGENPYQASIRYCSAISSENREKCFTHLISIVNYFKDEPSYRKEFCDSIPSDYMNACRERLIN